MIYILDEKIEAHLKKKKTNTKNYFSVYAFYILKLEFCICITGF